MIRTPQYEKLLEIKAGKLKKIERMILEALLKAPNGLTRPELIRIVSGKEPKCNLNYDTQDRKLRRGMEDLRDRGVMIISSARKAGYTLSVDPEAIQGVLLDMKKRIARLQKRVDIIESYDTKPLRDV